MPATALKAGLPKVRAARSRRSEILYRLNRLALYFVMLAYVPAILAAVGGMGYGAYVATAWAVAHWKTMGPITVRLLLLLIGLDLSVLIASALFLFGLLPLFFRDISVPREGESLNLRQHPKLLALIERLCRRLDVQPPDVFYLSPFEDTGIGDIDFKSADGRLFKNERTLVLGAAFIVHTRVDEFATILCHEMAHAATGDTRMCRLVARFCRSMESQLAPDEEAEDDVDEGDEGTRGGLPKLVLDLMLLGYYLLFSLFHLTDSRYRELRADRVAAEICGPQNVRNALIRIHLVTRLPQLSIHELWKEFSENERDLLNIYDEHRRRWRDLPEASRVRAENEMFMEPTSVWSEHPALADRIRNLADVRAKELVLDRPATTLFQQWESLEEQVTHELVTAGRAAYNAYLKALERQLRIG